MGWMQTTPVQNHCLSADSPVAGEDVICVPQSLSPDAFQHLDQVRARHAYVSEKSIVHWGQEALRLGDAVHIELQDRLFRRAALEAACGPMLICVVPGLHDRRQELVAPLLVTRWLDRAHTEHMGLERWVEAERWSV